MIEQIFHAPAQCRACQTPLPSVATHQAGFVVGEAYECKTCVSCGTMQTSIATASSLDQLYSAIYRNSKFISGYKRYEAYAKLTSHPVMRRLFSIEYSEDIYLGALTFLRSKAKAASAALKVLEVGSGLGYMTAMMSRSGYHAVGTDFNEHACSEAHRRYGCEFICGDLDEVERRHGTTFDVIVCLEVIEHVEDPFDLLLRMKQLLKPDGCLVLSTPNRTPGVAWATTEPPIHVSFFTAAGTLQLAQRLGAEIQFFHHTRRNWFGRSTPRNPKHIASLPGGVVDAQLEPNSNYFDSGPITLAGYLRMIVRACAKRLLPIDKSRIDSKPPADTRQNSIIFKLEFSRDAKQGFHSAAPCN